MAKQRIQKVLATAGFGSRRACELLVLEDRVCVNRKLVNTLPCMVDPATDKITVNGKSVRQERLAYFMLYKPRHVVCTQNDPSGRTRAVDLLVGVRERVFPVGRLDTDSTGLLIMTNDGELTQKLTHPSFTAPKTYRVEIDGSLSQTQLERLRSGVWLSEGKTSHAKVMITHRQRDKAILEITLREGRNREIRRMLAKVGHKVRRLTRISVGKLTIRKLSPGAFRPLTPEEVRYLYTLARDTPTPPPAIRMSRSRSGTGSGSRRMTRPAGVPKGEAPSASATKGQTQRKTTTSKQKTSSARKTTSTKKTTRPTRKAEKNTGPKKTKSVRQSGVKKTAKPSPKTTKKRVQQTEPTPQKKRRRIIHPQ